MRAMLFLLVGFVAAIVIGNWFFAAPAQVAQENAAPVPAIAETGGLALLWLLTGAAWLSAFIVRPNWLRVAHSVLVLALGLVVIAAGLLGSFLDGFNPSEPRSGPIVIGFGLLILASRALSYYLAQRASSTEDSA